MFNTSRATAAATSGTVAAPSLPRVNLLPPEIAEAAKFRRLQFAMGGAVVAAAAVVGVLYLHQHSAVKAAEDDLVTAQQQQTALQAQLDSLASVQTVYDQVAAKKAMLAQAMGPEIRWSYYLGDLAMKVPDNVWLTNVSAQESGGPAAPGAASTGSIGTVKFSGVAYSHDDVATWLDVLAKERGFTNAYFSNSTENFIGPKKVANFQSSVDVTDAAKSGRYTKPAGS